MQTQVSLEAEQAAMQARHLAGQMVVLQEHHKRILEQHRAHHAAALQRAKEEGQASVLLVQIEATKKISALHEELDAVYATVVDANAALSGIECVLYIDQR
jgi:hypothetical protein